MTRREFAALPLAAGAAAAGETKARPISIFSKHLQFLDIPAMAQTAKEIGFDAIDLTVRRGGHIMPIYVADALPRAVETIRGAGLDVSMITTEIGGQNVTQMPAIFDAMKVSGVRYFRWGGLRYYESMPVKQQIATLKQMAKVLANTAGEKGLCGIYHTHSGRNEFGASIWDIFAVIEDLDPKSIGINYDIGHATVEGGFGGWINSARLCGPHLRGVAIKDFVWQKNDKNEWRPQWCPLGEGMVDLARFGKMLPGVGFSGPIQLHFEYPMGGAEHGDRTLSWTREQVVQTMRRDLEKLRGYLKA